MQALKDAEDPPNSLKLWPSSATRCVEELHDINMRAGMSQCRGGPIFLSMP